MEFIEAVKLVKNLYKENCGYYLQDIVDEFDNNGLALRRKDSKVLIPSMPRYCDDGSIIDLLDIKTEFWDECTKAWFFYPFRFGDFLANDWEVILIDNFDEHKFEFKQTLAEFLLEKYEYENELLSHSNVVDKLVRLLEQNDKLNDNSFDTIDAIEIHAVLNDKRFELKSHFSYLLNDIKNLQDDVFVVDIYYKNGKSENLAEIEESE